MAPDRSKYGALVLNRPWDRARLNDDADTPVGELRNCVLHLHNVNSSDQASPDSVSACTQTHTCVTVCLLKMMMAKVKARWSCHLIGISDLRGRSLSDTLSCPTTNSSAVSSTRNGSRTPQFRARCAIGEGWFSRYYLKITHLTR
jgi:hypothetical protein